jgi:hypothetical protein
MVSRTFLALALAGCSGSGGGMQADDQPAADAATDTGSNPILGTAGCGMANTIATNSYVRAP